MADFKRQNKSFAKPQSLELGKLPPQALELEETVLGAIMLEKDAIFDVIDILKPEAFYKDAHKELYRAIMKLSERHDPIDILTVTEELKRNGMLDQVGGPAYVANLTSRVASAAHLEYHARIISQKFMQRELIRISTEIQVEAYEDGADVSDLLDSAEKKLFDIVSGNVKKESASIRDVLQDSIRMIEEAGKRDDGLSGVPCGFTRLDRVTNGWQPSDLIILAARPSMGKTAFSLTMMRNIAVNHKQPIAMFSLEMSNVQLINRLIVAETGLSSDKIRTGKLADYEWEQFEIKIKDLAEAPIFVDDTPAISIFELRAKLRRLKMQHDIQMVIIDYLQLMQGTPETRGNREQEVSTISRGLKAIAKELSVPILALSQLNRSVEQRSGDKRPQLSDLRESGAIEQDADIVMFIHRPEKYGIMEDAEGNSTQGLAEIILAKHRNGAVCDVPLKFVASQAKFVDPDDEQLPALPSDGFNSVTFSSSMNQSSSRQAAPPPKADDFVFSANLQNDEPPF